MSKPEEERKTAPRVRFSDFVEKFPEVELPVTLNEEQQMLFSRRNDPLSDSMIEQYILPHEPEHDEFTEYVPCLSYPATQGFHALVYWKGSLMRHEFILATYSRKGDSIDRKHLSGTRSKDGRIIQSIATLEEDWMIHVVEGIGDTGRHSYQAQESWIIQLELLADGRITLP
jgi:hypothetical protein